MIIFFNEKSEALAREVAAGLGARLGQIEKKTFPDGELYIRLLTPVKKETVVVLQTTRTNEDLIELLFTLFTAKHNGASKILCVVPHLIYQRQDEAFLPGEAVSAEVVLDMIRYYVHKIITINAHFCDCGGPCEFTGIAVKNLDAFPLLGKHFAGVSDLVIISPDEGAMQYAHSAAKAVGCHYDHLVKTRIDGETVEMQPKKLNVSGKNVVILDDIISTGGTMMKAADMMKKQGAKKVFIGCVHGVFAKGTDIFKGYDVVCTNSLPGKFSKVSLAPVIVGELKRHA